MNHSLKQKLGALVLDWPRFEWTVRAKWLEVKNRNERIEASPDNRGFNCKWQWTSDLHVAKIFPSLGARLMRRATKDWPIWFADAPCQRGDDVKVTFVIGHRGMERVPQLLATLATIAAQRDVRCECIVVEQSLTAEVRNLLPGWVRHVHTPLPVPDMPYCRSWSLNVGARLASGRLLVFHDNDMLVPEAYAAELWVRYVEGFEVINLKRFVFYLSATHSAEIQSLRHVECEGSPVAVVQNLEAGGSVAMERDAFFAVGGFDEGFVGWGGEDNEFWERAQTRRVWPYGNLPIVHLWHVAQLEKHREAPAANDSFRIRSKLPPQARISELAGRDFGNPQRLDLRWSTAGNPLFESNCSAHDAR